MSMKSKYNVRKPTDTEIQEITELLQVTEPFAENIKQDVNELKIEPTDCVESLFITVTEGYHSDCPSYCGDVFTILWGECCYVTQITRNSETKKMQIEPIYPIQGD